LGYSAVMLLKLAQHVAFVGSLGFGIAAFAFFGRACDHVWPAQGRSRANPIPPAIAMLFFAALSAALLVVSVR
jgi:hypothetical protein